MAENRLSDGVRRLSSDLIHATGMDAGRSGVAAVRNAAPRATDDIRYMTGMSRGAGAGKRRKRRSSTR
jgi:hypothetical protein